MQLTPKLLPGGKGFGLTFRHPFSGKVVAAGLGTRDEGLAGSICIEIDRLSRRRDLWDEPDPLQLATFDARAVEIFFRGRPAAIDSAASARDVLPAERRREYALALVRLLDRLPAEQRAAAAEGFFADMESEELRQLREDLQKAIREIRRRDGELEDLRAEYFRLKRMRNVHVKTTAREAFEQWALEYGRGRAPITLRQAKGFVKTFIDALPNAGAFKLGEIERSHVSLWLAGLKPVDAAKKELSPASLRQRKAYVSSFFTWCRERHNLFENPALEISVAGLDRAPESIVAIRRRDELLGFFKALEPEAYWQAWAMTACLAGPRFAEQCWLRVDQVLLDEGYLYIGTRTSGPRRVGTKTGRERRVPIEQTELREVLQAWLDRRRREQQLKTATPAQGSPWLFPSGLAEHPFMARKQSQVGQWSASSNFLQCWEAAARKILKLDEPEDPEQPDELPELPAPWTYGPREWRHTFGTVLGMCGWTSLEIARVMGNSPAIAERYYVAATSAGNRWPFKW